MASRFWVGGGSSANWSATGPTNWGTLSGVQDNASVPGSGDDVFFDGFLTGASNSTLSANITIKSLDMTGYANTLTHSASVTLTIGGASGVFKLASGMTYTLGSTSTSALSFTATSGTNAITTAGKVVGSVTFNGSGGTFQLQDALTATAGTITLTAGTFDTNNQTISASVLSFSGSTARTLTLGSSAISLSATSFQAFNGATTTNLTMTANTAVVTINGSNGGFSLGSFNYNGVSIVLETGLGHPITANGATIANLTKTGGAAKTYNMTVTGNLTVTGEFKVNGNSATNRVLVQSATLGTSITITAATVTITNADFRDITGAGAGSWNLSAITGLSGDCGGNSGITFTTGATQYWVGGTGSWSTAAEWGTSSGGSGGRVPLPQDDVRFDANSFSAGSQTVTQDMPRAGKNIDWTGATNTPTFTASGASVIQVIYGSLALISGMTFTATTATITFEGRGSHTLTMAGKTWPNHTLNVSMFGGNLTLQDNFSSGKPLELVTGTFTSNNFSVTSTSWSITNSAAVIVNMGSSTFTVNGTGNVVNLSSVTLPTINATSSTIVVSDTSATAKAFGGGSRTWGNVTFSGNNITVTGSNTFATMAVNNAGLTNGLILTAGTTQTITGLTTNGSSGNLAKLLSSSAGSAATLSKSSGTVSVDYMSIKDSTATGGASWYAGANSTNVSGNTGWTFTAPPGGTLIPLLIAPRAMQGWLNG